MAIKQRVLKSIRHAMNLLETCDTAVLPKIVASLKNVDGLLQVGLASEYRVQYEEIIDGVKSALQNADSKELAEVCLLSKDLLSVAEKQVTEETRFKREIVFLPYSASMWDSMESVWQAADADKDHAIAYVVPIPYFNRNPDGSIREWHCDAGKFPHYVPIWDYRGIDLEEMHPDVIVIHSPYDDTNIVTSVHPDYYSHNLKSYTAKLVYIPYFVHGHSIDPHDGVALGHFAHMVLTPGVLNADVTIVQSENMRKAYVNILRQGTNKADRGYWENRILSLGSPKIDRIINICRNPPPPPKKWKKKMRGKRIFFYNTSLQTMLRDPNAFLRKLRYVFDCFRGRNDVCLIWRPHPLLKSTFESMEKEYVEEYSRIVEEFRQSSIGLYDDSSDIGKTIALSDVYIGDAASSVTMLFGVMGKPLFFLNNNICAPPGKDDWLGSVNSVWFFSAKDWLIAYGNQLWHAPRHDFHFHHFCDLSEYGKSGCYSNLLEIGNKLFVCPRNSQNILVVEDEKIANVICLDSKKINTENFEWASYVYANNEDYFFLIPLMYPSVVRYDFHRNKLDYISFPYDIFVQEVNGEKWRGAFFHWREWLILGSAVDSKGFAIHRRTLESQVITVCHGNFCGSMFALCKEWGGNEYFFFPYTGRKVTRWNLDTGEYQEYDFPKNFKCRHPITGELSNIKPFSSGIFQNDTTIILAPLWGNMFVKLYTDTGVMEEWKTPFEVTTKGKNNYHPAGLTGFFIMLSYTDTKTWRPDTCHFYYAPERKRYSFDTETEIFTPLEQDTFIDESEMRCHALGFCQITENDLYGCNESAFNSLSDIIDDRISGKQFNKAKQLKYYSDMAVNINGNAGERIHEYLCVH